MRDKRQLIIIGILVKLNWPSYGLGRKLAKAFSVDPATISRDLKYIRKWRASLLKQRDMSSEFVDAIAQRLVVAGIHPRLGYSLTYTYLGGCASLRVRRSYAYALGIRRRLLSLN
jgi:hypothetical protein